MSANKYTKAQFIDKIAGIIMAHATALRERYTVTPAAAKEINERSKHLVLQWLKKQFGPKFKPSVNATRHYYDHDILGARSIYMHIEIDGVDHSLGDAADYPAAKKVLNDHLKPFEQKLAKRKKACEFTTLDGTVRNFAKRLYAIYIDGFTKAEIEQALEAELEKSCTC